MPATGGVRAWPPPGRGQRQLRFSTFGGSATTSIRAKGSLPETRPSATFFKVFQENFTITMNIDTCAIVAARHADTSRRRRESRECFVRFGNQRWPWEEAKGISQRAQIGGAESIGSSELGRVEPGARRSATGPSSRRASASRDSSARNGTVRFPASRFRREPPLRASHRRRRIRLGPKARHRRESREISGEFGPSEFVVAPAGSEPCDADPVTAVPPLRTDEPAPSRAARPRRASTAEGAGPAHGARRRSSREGRLPATIATGGGRARTAAFDVPARDLRSDGHWRRECPGGVRVRAVRRAGDEG